jgi:hypothetical protein
VEKGEKRVTQRSSAVLFFSFLCARIQQSFKKSIMKKILLALMLICSVNAFSQSDDMGDGDGTVPVDGGLSLLLAAGAAWGVRRFHRRSKHH